MHRSFADARATGGGSISCASWKTCNSCGPPGPHSHTVMGDQKTRRPEEDLLPTVRQSVLPANTLDVSLRALIGATTHSRAA